MDSTLMVNFIDQVHMLWPFSIDYWSPGELYFLLFFASSFAFFGGPLHLFFFFRPFDDLHRPSVKAPSGDGIRRKATGAEAVQ